MSKTILLADDSVTIRKVVELSFMEEDFDLVTATDGREAVSLLDGQEPDIVIADVHMPELGGFEVCREAKQRYPHVPVLLLVGAFEAFDPADAEACGADQFLKKPFDAQDLLRQVNALVSKAPGAPEVASGEHQVAAAGVENGSAAASTGTAGEAAAGADLSDEAVDRIARRVVELLSDEAIRAVAWEVVPDLAETVVKERLRELEQQVE
jgi:DNA-binding response OmpR family regulator